MRRAEKDFKALGISVDESEHCTYYFGASAALISAGIVRAEWLPGAPGNNKTMQRVVITPDGPKFLNGKGGKRYVPNDDETCLTIYLRGAKSLQVCRDYGPKELARRAETAEVARKVEVWRKAKALRETDEGLEKWKTSVTDEIGRLRKILNGNRYWEDLGRIAIPVAAEDQAERLLAMLEALVDNCTPRRADVEARGQVIYLHEFLAP